MGNHLLPRETSAKLRKSEGSRAALLRCTMITLFALLLADPHMSVNSTGKSEHTWILIPPGQFANAYSHYRPELDSFIQSGYEIRRFEPGFAITDFQQELKQKDNKGREPTSYWGY